jgi:hypothetical protein
LQVIENNEVLAEFRAGGFTAKEFCFKNGKGE